MPPVGLYLRLRLRKMSLRLISITTKVVSTNFLLGVIIDDIHTAATNGFGDVDATRKACVLFF